jgi:hypothetical protein
MKNDDICIFAASGKSFFENVWDASIKKTHYSRVVHKRIIIAKKVFSNWF